MCQLGQVSEPGSSGCTVCPTGSYRAVGMDYCTYCDVGMYQDQEGELTGAGGRPGAWGSVSGGMRFKWPDHAAGLEPGVRDIWNKGEISHHCALVVD
jgi:hypothetical protein